MTQYTLVIGASSGLAQAIISQKLQSSDSQVFGVSRSHGKIHHPRYQHITSDYDFENALDALVEAFEGVKFDQVYCCVGTLHDDVVFPEKKIEELSPTQLNHYFRINVVIPSMWLQKLPILLNKKAATHAVFFSARVGSTSDNRLGGWYSYRATKAALNSLIKSAQIELKRRLPKASLVLYHPGTVDTPLSKPFQNNVPNAKLFTPEFSAAQLLNMLPSLTSDNAPHYVDWQGEPIPW